MANLETAKDLANCAPPEGKTWSLFLKVSFRFISFLFYGTIFVRYDAVYSFHQIHYCTKVDCGNKRAGVRSEDAQAVKIVEFIHQHPK